MASQGACRRTVRWYGLRLQRDEPHTVHRRVVRLAGSAVVFLRKKSTRAGDDAIHALAFRPRQVHQLHQGD